MSPEICYLVTLLYKANQTLIKCAIKFKDRNNLPSDFEEDYLEPEHREWLKKQLPAHVASVGPIVALEEIFEVV